MAGHVRLVIWCSRRLCCMLRFFFFSSRRRHTRFDCDWSSDVCSSDLSCIALRTMVDKNGVAYVQAGGGIVADSTPEGEYQESVNKSKALLTALEEIGRASCRERV